MVVTSEFVDPLGRGRIPEGEKPQEDHVKSLFSGEDIERLR
jgi:hypothetical protein